MTSYKYANCVGAETELFFPHPSDEAAHAYVIGEYCDGCPARQQCLDDDLAASSGIHHGIRGGLSAAERDALSGRGSWRSHPRPECKNGHVYTPDNVTWTSRGRRCVTCLREAAERKRQREGSYLCPLGHQFLVRWNTERSEQEEVMP